MRRFSEYGNFASRYILMFHSPLGFPILDCVNPQYVGVYLSSLPNQPTRVLNTILIFGMTLLGVYTEYWVSPIYFIINLTSREIKMHQFGKLRGNKYSVNSLIVVD